MVFGECVIEGDGMVIVVFGVGGGVCGFECLIEVGVGFGVVGCECENLLEKCEGGGGLVLGEVGVGEVGECVGVFGFEDEGVFEICDGLFDVVFVKMDCVEVVVIYEGVGVLGDGCFLECVEIGVYLVLVLVQCGEFEDEFGVEYGGEQ